MKILAPFAPNDGLYPAIGWSGDTLRVAWCSLHSGRLVLDEYDAELRLRVQELESSGCYAGFPRMSPNGEWLIYKSELDGWRAVLRNLDTGDRRILLPANGNWPVAIDATRHAVQSNGDSPSGYVITIYSAQGTTTKEGAATGMLTIDRLMVDAQADWFPQTAGEVTVKQGPDGGVCCTGFGGLERWLWPGETTHMPCVAVGPNGQYAVATWGPEGVKVAICAREDFNQPMPVPPPEKPTVCLTLTTMNTVTAMIAHATDWRWLDGTTIVQHNGSSYTVSLTGTHVIRVRAAGPGGITESDPVTVTVAPPPAPFYGLQTGFGLPIGTGVYTQLAAKGWGVARIQAHPLDKFVTAACINEVRAAGMTPLVIVRPQDIVTLPEMPGLLIELYNEADIGSEPTTPRLTPADYCARLHSVLDLIESRRYVCYVGAISNLSTPALSWLRQVLACVPVVPWLRVSAHFYGDKAGNPAPPNPSSLAALQIVVGPRRWAITETGIHVGPYTTGFWFWKKTQTLSEPEQARKLHVNAEAFKTAGADFCVIYQLNSSPSEYYGIRRVDNSWRPAADVPRL